MLRECVCRAKRERKTPNARKGSVLLDRTLPVNVVPESHDQHDTLLLNSLFAESLGNRSLG